MVQFKNTQRICIFEIRDPSFFKCTKLWFFFCKCLKLEIYGHLPSSWSELGNNTNNFE